MKLEILDANGNLVDELPASKRRGLNRVNWSMRTKPPQVPPAASLAFYSTQGQRVLPGNYTVRLTKGGQVTTAPLAVTLDRRASFTVADRQAQYARVGAGQGPVRADEQAGRTDQQRARASRRRFQRRRLHPAR